MKENLYLHKQAGDKLKTYITITEPQEINALTFLLNKTIDTQPFYTRCKFINESGEENVASYTFFDQNRNKNNIRKIDHSSTIAPIHNMFKVEFFAGVTSEETVAPGTYRIEIEYTTANPNNPENWIPFKNEDFIWGINPKKVSDASLTAYIENNYNKADDEEVDPEYAFKQDEVYGQVFRFNNSIFNMRGGEAYDNMPPTYYAIEAGNKCSLAIVAKASDIPPETGVVPNEFRLVGWGNNRYNQLGLATATPETSPQKQTIIPLIKPCIVKKYRDMKCGKYHTLFLTNDGEVYSWGGETAKAKPHLVEGLKGKNIISISANGKSYSNDTVDNTGYTYSSALDNEGNIYIWSDTIKCKNNENNPIKITGGKNFTLK